MNNPKTGKVFQNQTWGQNWYIRNKRGDVIVEEEETIEDQRWKKIHIVKEKKPKDMIEIMQRKAKRTG